MGRCADVSGSEKVYAPPVSKTIFSLLHRVPTPTPTSTPVQRTYILFFVASSLFMSFFGPRSSRPYYSQPSPSPSVTNLIQHRDSRATTITHDSLVVLCLFFSFTPLLP